MPGEVILAKNSIGRCGAPVSLVAMLAPAVLFGAVGEAERRAQIDLICQPIVEEGRARLQRTEWLAEEDYRAGLANCKGDPSCIQRVRAYRLRRGRLRPGDGSRRLDRIRKRVTATGTRPADVRRK